MTLHIGSKGRAWPTLHHKQQADQRAALSQLIAAQAVTLPDALPEKEMRE